MDRNWTQTVNPAFVAVFRLNVGAKTLPKVSPSMDFPSGAGDELRGARLPIHVHQAETGSQISGISAELSQTMMFDRDLLTLLKNAPKYKEGLQFQEESVHLLGQNESEKHVAVQKGSCTYVTLLPWNTRSIKTGI